MNEIKSGKSIHRSLQNYKSPILLLCQCEVFP